MVDERGPREPRRWATIAIAMLSLRVATRLGACFLLAVVVAAISGPSVDRAALLEAKQWEPVAGALLLLLFAASTVAWLVWLSKAMQLARLRFAAEPTTLPTTGQTVAAYFIPIVSITRPYRHLTRLVAASDPTALPDPPEERERVGDYRTAARERVERAPWSSRVPVLGWWSTSLLGAVLGAVAALNAAQPRASRHGHLHPRAALRLPWSAAPR